MKINNISILKPLSDDDAASIKTYILELENDAKFKLILDIFDEEYKYNIVTDENTILEKNIIQILEKSDIVAAMEYVESDDNHIVTSHEEKVEKILSVYSESELSEIKKLLIKCGGMSMGNAVSFSPNNKHIAKHNDQFFVDKIELFEGVVENLKKLRTLNKL